MYSSIINAIQEAGYDIIHQAVKKEKVSNSVSYEDMNISARSKSFMRACGIPTLWKHQRLAIETALSNKNVCISTSTSSGKTEIFQITAIEILEKNPNARVLAIYSAKALNSQQKERWTRTGLSIGQIDGSDTDTANRLNTLQNSKVVVMTPDVMHAFLLGKLSKTNCKKIISDFIKNVEFVIIDEIHLYRGVFGTNASYLFRRFNNARRLLRHDITYPLYMTASATLPNPDKHSENITGVADFVNIGKELDGSPISKTNFIYIKPGDRSERKLPSIANLPLAISKVNDAKSITFVESRQRTGEIVLNLNGGLTDELKKHEIYPYRAGMEEEAREEILSYMKEGKFKGIVSTSALEIGIDIDGLNVAIIANIPYDRNSYYQRIGRVGRGNCKESYVILVFDGSFKSHLLFGECNFDIDSILPELEPSLYLESKNINYVHAACHVDFDKECCEIQACDSCNFDDVSKLFFPEHFFKICQQVANHQTSRDYNQYEDIEDPHIQYSLRNNGVNYSFCEIQTNEVLGGENVTRQQMLREAYKGAIRNITHRNNGNIRTINQEVTGVDKLARTIFVKNIKDTSVTSKPITQTIVLPNFSPDRRFKTISCGDMLFFNLELYEKVYINGYKRIYYGNVKEILYERPFIDTLRTTGVIMFHPVLNKKGVERSKIAHLIFEAFLMRNAFDRNDINYKSEKLYTPNVAEGLKGNDRFTALYDINLLNITANLVQEHTLKDTFEYLSKHSISLANSLYSNGINTETQEAVNELCRCILFNKYIDQECQEIGDHITIFGQMSPALYQPFNNQNSEEDLETDNAKWQPCQVLSPVKNDLPNTVKYTILCNGQPIFDVPQECLMAIENSSYTKFDWKNGQQVE